MQRDLLLLEQIVEAGERLQALTDGLTAEEIAEDELRRDALLWNFTVLGEATAQLSEELRAAHDSVQWRRPAQLRNRIVHGYWSIDFEILVSTATDDLPEFVRRVRQVIVEPVGTAVVGSGFAAAANLGLAPRPPSEGQATVATRSRTAAP